MENPHAKNMQGDLPEYWAGVNAVLDTYETLSPDDALRVHRAHYQSGDNESNHLEALGHLPSRNPEHAAAVYRAFAESSDPDVRGQIVLYLTHLSLVDRAAGLELWDHLIRDPDARVRADAFSEIQEHLQDSHPSPDPAAQAELERVRQEHIGLTWQDLAHLYRAHLKAADDSDYRYQPGGTGAPDSE